MSEEQTTVDNITVDGKEYVVAELPDAIQKAITKYNGWNVLAQERQEALEIIAGALRDLGGQIVGAVREVAAADAAAAAEAAAAEAVVEEETPVAEEASEEAAE